MRVSLQWVVFKCLNVCYHKGKCWSLEGTVTIPRPEGMSDESQIPRPEGMSEKSQLPNLEGKRPSVKGHRQPKTIFHGESQTHKYPSWSPNGAPNWPSSEVRGTLVM